MEKKNVKKKLLKRMRQIESKLTRDTDTLRWTNWTLSVTSKNWIVSETKNNWKRIEKKRENRMYVIILRAINTEIKLMSLAFKDIIWWNRINLRVKNVSCAFGWNATDNFVFIWWYKWTNKLSSCLTVDFLFKQCWQQWDEHRKEN